MLSDPRGEDHGVDQAKHRVVGADVLADPVAVDVERQRGGLVARGAQGHELAEVVVAGEPFQPGLAVERAVDVVQGPAELAMQVGVHSRVEVARPGAHHQTPPGA